MEPIEWLRSVAFFTNLFHDVGEPVWLSAVLHMNFAVAVITPPMALNLFVMSGIMKAVVSFEEIARGTLPSLFSESDTVGILLAFWQLVPWLPSTIKG